MNRLNQKLILRILLVFGIVVIFSILMNTLFLPKYLLYQNKHELANLTDQLETMEASQLHRDVGVLENEHNVTIVHTDITDNNDVLNSRIKEQLNSKGITLSKFWITDTSIEKVKENIVVRKIYSQEKLKSSFLVSFIKKDTQVYVVGKSISHSTDTLKIVNRFQLYIYAGELLLLIVLSGLFTMHIVRPLAKIQKAAEGISNLSFTKVHIQTGDEIQALAESMNQMSDKLEHAHQALEDKNHNLREFIANISHELKTPLSLIKAYSLGIKDGLDDGTYIDVIQQQTDDISRLVSRLLELSRLQIDEYQFGAFDFKLLLHRTLQKYLVSIQQMNLILSVEQSSLTESWVFADEQKIEMVLNNFISNAMKYSTNKHIQIAVENQGNDLLFSITNGVEDGEQLQWDHIWEPFFVLENSRSKLLSGTGLGLSIARTILQKHDSLFGFQVQNGEIGFHFSLPLIPKQD
ncbi:HAMP domain-containing sensor histidine kinase [Cohnella sp. WQ 127256]|uniref:HAMP domain-containing sensor histidine kinase n=1 Tax=Cohnella sp. WQ 127256 TaxID=2938790 RepID=UPI002118FFFF|nr:HAMP domain-containing sensor histidine kinase [Cohnella sp. WQ 127256]